MKNISDKEETPSAADDCAQAINESRQGKASAVSNSRGGVALLSADRELRETVYGSDDYKKTLELRHRVLRQPLGLNLWNENLSVEINQRHFSIWQKPDELLACVVIVPMENACVKLRQMAVNPDYQRQGLGRRLIAAVETILINDGVKLIELHARTSAEIFYKGCGYQSVGEIFTEVGIDHRCMTKLVAPAISHL